MKRRLVVVQQGNCEKKTSEGASRNIVKRGPALEQQGIFLQEDQWWSSREYCYKRTSGGVAGNIVERELALEQQGYCEKGY